MISKEKEEKRKLLLDYDLPINISRLGDAILIFRSSKKGDAPVPPVVNSLVTWSNLSRECSVES